MEVQELTQQIVTRTKEAQIAMKQLFECCSKTKIYEREQSKLLGLKRSVNLLSQTLLTQELLYSYI